MVSAEDMSISSPTLLHDQPVHAGSVQDVLRALHSDGVRGLSSENAAERLQRSGPNVLPTAARASALRRLTRQLHSPLIYILLISGAIALALGERVDAGVILGVVVLNAAVGFVQESRAEASLEALRSLVLTTARAVRDGRLVEVPSEGLVPGDLVVLQAGDKVPADLRLIREEELEVDESALTGESVPIVKDQVVLHESTELVDRRNMAWSGTPVTAGTGVGVVVATGAATQLGDVQRLLRSAEDLATPLTRKLALFSTRLTIVILGLAAMTFAVGVMRGTSASDMFSASVALAVGAIPEGLPAAITVTLAIGVRRMARRRAVVRRMPAVETLGSTTVICTDKTGTLTQNQMTVTAVWTSGGTYDVTGSGYDAAGSVADRAGRTADRERDAALHACLLAGLACNDSRLIQVGSTWSVLGDPTEAALLVSAGKLGLTREAFEEDQPRSSTIPFSSDRQWMATAHEGAGGELVYVKGSAERVLPLCHGQLAPDGCVSPLQEADVLDALHKLADDGLRVLAFAVGRREAAGLLDPAQLRRQLVFVGLQAMIDPPRPTAASAIAACRTAGIEVKMITGDHVRTATAIARRLGLLDTTESEGAVLSGAELSGLGDEEYKAVAARATVFARVTPQEKLRLVRAMQDSGQVVAMTGDGVNDAPALQQADIGVAMGRGGTEVAKDAADIVLTDDDFATIEGAVEEGRGVFDNLVKFIVWTLPTNGAQALVILTAVLAGAVLPLLPVQILWINMTTAVALGLMLAFEPTEGAIMLRPPRSPKQPLLTRDLVQRTILAAVLLVAATWTLFTWEQQNAGSLEQARTAALNLFVAVSVLYLFHCRSLTESAHRLGLLSNRWILGGVSVQIVAQLLLTYAPMMQSVFDTAALDVASWLRILGLSLVVWAVIGVDKWWRSRPLRQPTGHGPDARRSAARTASRRRARRPRLQLWARQRR